MKKLLLFLILSCLAAFRVQADDGIVPWQFVLQYSPQGFSIVSGERISLDKNLTHPGMKESIETQRARISWYRGADLLATAITEVPFGNRYATQQSAYGVSTVRILASSKTTKSDSVTIQLLGIETRFGIRVQEEESLSPVVSFDLDRVSLRSGLINSRKIHDTGPDSNRYVMVLVGDGYRLSDINGGTYLADAEEIVTYLRSQSPWDELLNVTNIYVADVESNEAGADNPSISSYVDTYFNTSYWVNGIDRLLAPDSVGEARAISVADAVAGAGAWDSILILVNATTYGGSGGTVATISMHPTAPEIAVHEFGHTIAGLADEYDSAYPGYPEQVTEPNVDTDYAHPKWSTWLTSGVPLPTPDEAQYDLVVGAFEGARYKTTGVYRPMRNCKMRALGVAFCPICKESITQEVLRQNRSVDGFSPSNASRIKLSSTGQTFKITPSPFGKTKVTWTLCNKALSGTKKSIKIKPSMLSKRNCPLIALPEIKSDFMKSNVSQQQIKWKLQK